MKSVILTAVAFLSALPTIFAQQPPKGFEKVDLEIVVTAVRTQMKYDVGEPPCTPKPYITLNARLGANMHQYVQII